MRKESEAVEDADADRVEDNEEDMIEDALEDGADGEDAFTTLEDKE